MSNRSWKKVILGLVFLALSIFYTVLFFRNANFGQMMTFNIAHIKSLTNIFTSPINFDYWNHSGSQINLFSPWLTLLSGWLFVQLNVSFGFSIYLTLITFLTLISAYYFMNRFHEDTFESILFAGVYTFSMNRFMLVFSDQRIENYLALIFLPLIYYGAYELFTDQGWKTLVWGEALIVWTAPYVALAVNLTLIPIVFLVLFTHLSHSWKYWGHLSVNFLKAVGLVVLTTIGFMGPLVIVQSQQKLQQVPVKNFDYLSWFFNLRIPRLQGYLLMAIAGLLLVLCLMIFLQSSFAYKIIILEAIPLAWLVIAQPKIQFLDISRLIFSFQSILDFFLILILCRIVLLIFQESPAILRLLLLLAMIGGLGYFNYYQANALNPKQTIIAADSINYQNYVENYHDKATNGNNRFLVNGQEEEISYNTKESDYWIQYINPKTVDIDIPIQYLDSYQVLINNESVKAIRSDRQTVRLKTNPGKNIIEIHSRYSWTNIIFLLINLCGFIMLIYLNLKNIRLKNKKNPENG